MLGRKRNERTAGLAVARIVEDGRCASTNRCRRTNYFLACGDQIFVGEVRCYAAVRTDVNSAAIARAPDTSDSTGPFRGFTPKDLRSAYNLPNTGGAGRTIGIVDALDDPLAESDLAMYRAHFHLPPCTTANGCFRKLNQDRRRRQLPVVQRPVDV